MHTYNVYPTWGLQISFIGFKFKQTESDWLENKKYTFCVCTVIKYNVVITSVHSISIGEVSVLKTKFFKFNIYIIGKI